MVDLSNSVVVFDTEANGLLEEVTAMWCLYLIDTKTGLGYLYHDYPQYDNVVVEDDGKKYTIPVRSGSLKDGARDLYKSKKLVAHNLLGYDLFLLNKFFPQFKLKKMLPKCWDTLIQSKNQRFDRSPMKGYKGIHGLDVWGGRLGYKKPPVTDWKTMSAFKLHRCIVDTEINVATYNALNEEAEEFKRFGVDCQEGMLHDHTYKFNATVQELNGALVDRIYAEGLVIELDELLKTLAAELEPQLPHTIKRRSSPCTWGDVGKTLKWKKWPATKKEVRERLGEKKVYDIKPTVKPTTKLIVATGNYGVRVAEWFGIDPKSAKTERMVSGPYSKVAFERSKLSQHELVKEFLITQGWKPTEWNYRKDKEGKFITKGEWPNKQRVRSSPKLTEDSYDSIEGSLGKDIAKYNTYSHRRRFLENPKNDEKGLINNLREDDRLPCGLNTFGTATGRSAQYGWVNAPGAGKLFGEETRRCIIAPEGRVLVGADMKSAQLSIAAYYARNYDYYLAVVDGEEEIDDPNDPAKKIYVGESGHCVNARAFGLVSEEEWKSAVETQDSALLYSIMLRRKNSKGGSFATLFGATGKKVATTLKIPDAEGEIARNNFLSEIGLDEPIHRLGLMTKSTKYKSGGYIELPFGYWVWCRSAHKYFNYLDQGTEAACQKVAVNYFEKNRLKLGLDAVRVLDVHDEFLVESDFDCQDDVGRLMCESYKYASDKCFEWHKEKSKWFGDVLFPFNLDGGYKVGKNYWDVH